MTPNPGPTKSVHQTGHAIDGPLTSAYLPA
jgi:hypothetical protein